MLQVMWWLRLTQLKTYPPDPPEAADFARRAGISQERVERWFDDAIENYQNMGLSEKVGRCRLTPG